MKQKSGILRHFGLALVLSILFYATFFAWLQHRRTTDGPWQIAFRTDAAGSPSLLITESNLHIAQTVSFPAQKLPLTNLSQTVQFRDPVTNLPFGQMLFQDPTFLPGTVTMELFGHQVELLPRFVRIDDSKYRWGAAPGLQVR